jgi:putative DNA primase/helicase
MNKTKWPTATRENPCPKCGKVNRCRIAPDGRAGICWRSGSSEVWRDTRTGVNGNGQHLRPDPPRPRAKPTFISADMAIEAAGKSIEGGKLAVVWKYPGDVARVARFNLKDGSKEFRPVHRLDIGAWAIGDPPGLWPLYRVDELPTVGPVYVCEGEKATDCAWSIGLPALTSAHGSNAADKTDWTPLAGCDVVILPDNDSAGEHYAQDVMAILLRLNPTARVKVARLPDLPPGGDIVEFDSGIGGEACATKAAVEELVAKTPFMDATDVVGGPMLARMADIEAREVRWLWRGRIPLGRITLLVGRPGEGKSFFTMDAAARVSTGSHWPDDGPCERGSVLIISGEDDPADTIRPRLDAHHADVSRVHLLSMVRRIGEDGKPLDMMFSLHDIVALEAALQRLHDCKLIVIDPIGSFLGGDVDAHRDNEVRSILAPVAKLAEKYGPAVLVVAHRRKSAGNIADDLALGSRAFTGIARAVWHLTRDSENKARRLLLPGKNNLAREGDGLAFTIAGDPPAIAWERKPVQMSADDALAIENDGGHKEEAKPGPEPQARKAAEDWLRKLLAGGEVPAAKVKEEAKAAGMNFRTVQRAADELGVIREKNTFNGGWQWRFPKPGTATNEDDNRT